MNAALSGFRGQPNSNCGHLLKARPEKKTKKQNSELYSLVINVISNPMEILKSGAKVNDSEAMGRI